MQIILKGVQLVHPEQKINEKNDILIEDDNFKENSV